MSDVTERIREARKRDEAAAESEFVAPEATEPPEPAEPEPEPEPEPDEEEAVEPEEASQATGGLDAEQAVELEKATSAYYKRIAKVFGGELPPECGACNGLGFDLFGGEGAPEFSAHEHYTGCHECKGLGKVLTGSQVQGHDLADCPKCLGRGYLEKLPTMAAVPSEPEQYGTPSWMGNVEGRTTS